MDGITNPPQRHEQDDASRPHSNWGKTFGRREEEEQEEEGNTAPEANILEIQPEVKAKESGGFLSRLDGLGRCVMPLN